MGARIGPRPRTSMMTDSTRADSRWSYRSRTMALATTTAALAPTAWMNRRAIIAHIECATAQPMQANRYTATPISRIGRRPILSDQGP